MTPRVTFHPTFRPRAPQVSSNSPSLYLTPPAPTVMPSAHLCSPVTRAHRSVLAPLDARALLHHYPMPLEPAFSPLARPAPPPCLPSLYCARCLLLRCTACNSKQSLRPEGVRISPGCWRGAAARSGPRPTGCWVLPDPHPCASSPSSLNPSSPPPPSHPPRGPRRRRLCCRLHRHRLRRRRRHRRCYRRRSRRRSCRHSCRSPPLTSPNTTHHPPTVGGPRQRHKGRGKGGGGKERGAGPRGRGRHRSLWRADAVRWPHSWPSRAECCGACAVAHMGTWNMSVCRPPPACADGVLLCVSKILSNMCSILMSGYQTKAYHLISRSEVFLSPRRVSALQGAGNMIRKPPNQAASAHRGLRSRSHWGVG